jgi:hypothetical protein
MSHKHPYDLILKATFLLGRCQSFIRDLPDAHIGKMEILHSLDDFDKEASARLRADNLGGE